MSIKVDLHRLTKEQIIALAEQGALVSEVVPQAEAVIRPKVKPVRRRKRPKPKLVTKATRQDVRARIQAVKQELAKGKTLGVKDMVKMGMSGDQAKYLIHKYFKPSRSVIVKGGQRGHPYSISPSKRLYKESLVEPQVEIAKPKKRKHRRKSEYNRFLSKRIKELRKEGKQYMEANRQAQREWTAKKQGFFQPSLVEFPKFESVQAEYAPILKAILERCIKNKEPIDFKGVNYPLDLRTEADYRRFIDDVLSNSKALKEFFDVEKGRFRYDGISLRFH